MAESTRREWDMMQEAMKVLRAQGVEFGKGDVLMPTGLQHLSGLVHQTGEEFGILSLITQSRLLPLNLVMDQRALVNLAKDILRNYQPTIQDEILSALLRIEESLQKGN